jgi:uncharacterized protein (DUF2141 family)
MKNIILMLLFLTTSMAGTVLAEDSPTPTAETLVPVRQQVQKGRIIVKVTGLRSTNGDLIVALFNSKQGFPVKMDKAVRKLVVSAEGTTHEAVIDDVPYGSWAVSVQHDENRSGKLDTNFLGMPKEGVGASNNPRSRFGPPSFDAAKFTLDKSETEVVINLRYL